MVQGNIALCYYPTTIVFVDDNETYLENMRLKFSKHFPCVCFSDPVEALDFLNEKPKWPSFISECIGRQNEDTELSDHVTRDINLQKISQQSLNTNRFKDIMLLVTDQSMPGLDGIELCKKIKGKNTLKIMLTGEADKALAIQAFNERVIDKFIRKDEPNAIEELLNSVNNLLQQQFFNLSEKLLLPLENRDTFPIYDHTFAGLLNEIIATKDIVEYYILDAQGSYMLANRLGEVFTLAVKDEDAMKALHYQAELEELPHELVQSLADRTHLIYINENNNQEINPHAWHKHCHPATKLQGEKTYYYSLIENAVAPLESSFENYLRGAVQSEL